MGQPRTPTNENETAWVLRRHAHLLDATDRPRSGLLLPRFELMSGALVWADEVPPGTPVEVVWSLRYLWHHWTGLIIGELHPHAGYWEVGRELFPHWGGFQPVRCRPSHRFAAIYRAGRIATLRGLAELEKRLGKDRGRGATDSGEGGVGREGSDVIGAGRV